LSSPETDARAARLAFERLLQTEARHMAPMLPPGFGEACERFVALLLAANARLNLTRIVEPEAVARLHLLDAVAALPLVDRLSPDRALDLGTGGGVPGLVLAIARPDVRWTLVDSVGKKVDALREIVVTLGLRNVQPLAGRAELLGRATAHREAHDLVTARACASLPVLAEYALPLLRRGGTLLAWKGRLSDDELRAGAAAAAELGGDGPETAATGLSVLGDHRFILVRKERPTPVRYPRRPGDPAREPLGT
jgi:16S rRNA (guanine527-N7)-methyltransferase